MARYRLIPSRDSFYYSLLLLLQERQFSNVPSLLFTSPLPYRPYYVSALSGRFPDLDEKTFLPDSPPLLHRNLNDPSFLSSPLKCSALTGKRGDIDDGEA